MTISVPPDAYKLAIKLYDLGAEKKGVVAVPELTGPDLNDLLQKKVATRTGAAKGRAVAKQPGVIKMIVPKTEIYEGQPKKKRTPAPAAASGPKHKNLLYQEAVSLNAVKRFIKDLEANLSVQMGPRQKDADKAIAAARKAVADAEDDDAASRAATVLTEAVRAKRELEGTVVVEVVKSMAKADATTHLQAIYAAMTGPN